MSVVRGGRGDVYGGDIVVRWILSKLLHANVILSTPRLFFMLSRLLFISSSTLALEGELL